MTGQVLFAATLLALAVGDHESVARFRGGAATHLASNFLRRDELDAAMIATAGGTDARLREGGQAWSESEAFANVGKWLDAVSV